MAGRPHGDHHLFVGQRQPQGERLAIGLAAHRRGRAIRQNQLPRLDRAVFVQREMHLSAQLARHRVAVEQLAGAGADADGAGEIEHTFGAGGAGGRGLMSQRRAETGEKSAAAEKTQQLATRRSLARRSGERVKAMIIHHKPPDDERADPKASDPAGVAKTNPRGAPASPHYACGSSGPLRPAPRLRARAHGVLGDRRLVGLRIGPAHRARMRELTQSPAETRYDAGRRRTPRRRRSPR